MKVLLLCVALVAVTLAMPVAEEKPAQPDLSLPSINEIKPEEKKVEPIAEKKEDKAPKPEIKPAAPALKAAASEPKLDSKVSEVVKVEPVPESPKQPQLESKSIIAAASEQAVKPVTASLADPKPEAKAVDAKLVDPKPVESKAAEPKSAESVLIPESKPTVETKPVEVAEVKEIKKDEIVGKSAIPEESIDIVSAVKNPAAIADDVVDPAAIIPTPQKKIDLPVVAGKSVEPVKEVIKPIKDEVKPELKSAEKVKDSPVAPISSAPAQADTKPAEVSNDESARVNRDTKDKPEEAVKAPAVETKSAEPEKVVAAEPIKEVKSVKSEEPLKEAEKVEPAKSEVASAEVPKEASVKAAIPEELKPVEPNVETAKKQKVEKPLGDAPANSSEESSESSESAESSEAHNDSAEKPL